LTQYIPVVFVTAMDDDVDEAYGLEVGAVDYITKPVSPIIVKSRVKIHLALSDHERELDRKVREKTALINKTRLDIIEILGRAAEYKDNETGNHIIRMSQYSYLIALSHGMDKRDAELLRNAAPMHDVGKIGIPDKILLKAGPLDDEEWQIMRTHSQMGAIIIGDHDSKLLITACIIAKEHHERWDGNGYPKGLKERDIDLYARIVAIADVFDALTSKRPYKEPWSSERAFDYIVNEKGKHFDPELVDAFENSIDEILKIKDALAD